MSDGVEAQARKLKSNSKKDLFLGQRRKWRVDPNWPGSPFSESSWKTPFLLLEKIYSLSYEGAPIVCWKYLNPEGEIKVITEYCLLTFTEEDVI